MWNMSSPHFKEYLDHDAKVYDLAGRWGEKAVKKPNNQEVKLGLQQNQHQN